SFCLLYWFYLSIIVGFLDYIFIVDRTYSLSCLFFFYSDPSSTEIYTLSLHDALPISLIIVFDTIGQETLLRSFKEIKPGGKVVRSEEHTSELQSRFDLVCRLLLEKKKYTCNRNQFSFRIFDNYYYAKFHRNTFILCDS